jgi:FkbM family methyltransferase
MPITMVKVPRNESVLEDFGPYATMMSLGQGTTSTQRKLADGLHGFEPGTQSTLLTLVQLASRPVHFFDVGAHIGMHSLIISSVYPASAVHVTAFEPTPKTAAVCRALAGANDFEIRIERCAVSSEDGTAPLYISPWETSNSLVAGFRPAQDVMQVPAITLDTYCARRGVFPSVIKVDVESYESQVVTGAMQVLEQARPSLVIEILRDTDPAAIEQTVGPMASLGYHTYRWTRADAWSECTPRDVVDQIAHDGNDWLFMPDAMDDGFRAALAAWRAAVAECRANHTVRVADDALPRPEYYRLPVLERAQSRLAGRRPGP